MAPTTAVIVVTPPRIAAIEISVALSTSVVVLTVPTASTAVDKFGPTRAAVVVTVPAQATRPCPGSCPWQTSSRRSRPRAGRDRPAEGVGASRAGRPTPDPARTDGEFSGLASAVARGAGCWPARAPNADRRTTEVHTKGRQGRRVLRSGGARRPSSVCRWKNSGKCGVPSGIRTRVLALKGPRPGPLDDGDARGSGRSGRPNTR